MEDLVNALGAMGSSDKDTRFDAEQWLADIKAENLGPLMGALAEIMANTEQDQFVRSQAGLQLKNSVSGQHGKIRAIDKENWSNVEEETRNQIKAAALATLGTEPSSPSTAAQVYSTIATIELAYWPNALPDLLARIEGSPSEDLLVAVLDALGYMTKDITDIDPDLLKDHSNDVLNAVIGSMVSDGVSTRIQCASLKALSNSLEFCDTNFETPDERTYIIQSVGQLSVADDPQVAQDAINCLRDIADIYYDFVADFMDDIHNAIGHQMMSENDDICLSAIDFWSTLAEHELEILDEAEDFQGHCLNYLEQVLPSVLSLLTRQEEDDDEDEFTVSKSASVCLGLLAEVVGDPIVDPTIDFVNENMTSEMWNRRDASVMAFGGILSGPDAAKISPLLDEAAIPIMRMINDPSTVVQDTVAWAIGRMTEMYPEVMLQPKVCSVTLECLAAALLLAPRVATNACWSLTNVVDEASRIAFDNLGEDADTPETFMLSEHFEGILGALDSVTHRDDVDESHLMEASFEALMSLFQCAPTDCFVFIENFAPSVVQRLKEVAQAQPTSPAHLKFLVSLLGRLCSLTQTCIAVLKPEDVASLADDFVAVLDFILGQENNTYEEIAEDALMATSELMRKFNKDFYPHIETFKPHILKFIKNTEHSQTCGVAVGVLSDLIGCLQNDIVTYADEIIATLLEVLAVQDEDLNREAKPQVLSALGDIAQAIGEGIQPHLQMILDLLEGVSGTVVAPIDTGADSDDVALHNKLRENLIEAYTGIFQALTDDNAQATPLLMEISGAIENFLNTLSRICSDSQFSVDGIRLTAGFIGDCLRAFGGVVKQNLSPDFIAYLVQKGTQSGDITTASTVEWMQGHYHNT